MSIQCETLAADDIPQACELFANVFGHPTQPEHWRWKYHQGPRLGAFNIIARNPDGQIVGHVGASVFPGHIHGQSLPMAQVSDVMVQANARSAYGQGQGIYPQLMKSLQKQMHASFPKLYTYGFVGIRPYKLGERMGLYRERQQCRTGRMTEPGEPAGLLNGYHQARPVGWPQALGSSLFDKTSAQARQQVDRPMLERSREYMRWRYFEHPVHTYQLWVVRRWGRDTGWIVTRHMPSGEHMLIDQWPAPADHAADRCAHRDMAAVLRQLFAADHHAPILASWRVNTPQAQQSEPVIGIEIRIHEWQDHIESPIFSPGDTDVF